MTMLTTINLEKSHNFAIHRFFLHFISCGLIIFLQAEKSLFQIRYEYLWLDITLKCNKWIKIMFGRFRK